MQEKKKIASSKGIAFIPLLIILAAGGGITAFAAKLGIMGAAADLLAAIIAAFGALLGGITMTLMGLSQDLLNWVIGPNFIGVSMTGMDNPIIAVGWTRIRDLANIFLILATIIIAIGIILGFEEYRAKKTLPTLIIIALLINFTPVICGFIIDFSNTLMKWVLGVGGVHPGFVEVLKNGWDGLQSQDDALKKVLASLSYVIFGLVGAIIYLLFALLFALRYIFLWILVVFSPIAFVSRVFGPSDKIKKFFPGFLHWDQWWNDFLTWNIIGIFAAFFIFLANALMQAIAFGTAITSNPTGDLAAFGALFIYLLPLLLLLIGFFSTISMTQEVMTATVPGMQAALTTMAKTSARVGKYAGKKAGEAIPEKVKEWGQAQARYIPSTANYGRGEAGAKGWFKRRAGQVATAATSPYWMARRGIGKAIGAGAKGQMDDANQTLAEMTGMATEKQLEKYNTASTRGEKIGALLAMIKDQNIDDARAMMSDKERKKFDESVKKDMGEAAMVSRDLFTPIARAFPHFADETVEKLNPAIRSKMLLGEKDELIKDGYTDEKGNASYGRKIIAGMKPQHVPYMDMEAIKVDKEGQPIHRPIWEEIQRSWGGYHDEAAIGTYKKFYTEPYMKMAEEKGAMWRLFKNPASFVQLSSPYVSAESGWFSPEGVTYKEAVDWTRRINKFNPEESKKAQDAMEKLPIETRRDLTQCLKIDPNRIEELRGEDDEGIERKIEKWKEEWKKEQEKGRAAESSAEEKIKRWENEITEEERKIETGESPNFKKIRDLKARIRKLKQGGPDQSAREDEGSFEPTQTPSVLIEPEERRESVSAPPEEKTASDSEKLADLKSRQKSTLEKLNSAKLEVKSWTENVQLVRGVRDDNIAKKGIKDILMGKEKELQKWNDEYQKIGEEIKGMEQAAAGAPAIEELERGEEPAPVSEKQGREEIANLKQKIKDLGDEERRLSEEKEKKFKKAKWNPLTRSKAKDYEYWSAYSTKVKGPTKRIQEIDDRVGEIISERTKAYEEMRKIESEEMGKETTTKTGFSDIVVITKELEVAKRRKENYEKQLANTKDEEEMVALTKAIKDRENNIRTLEEQLAREKNREEEKKE